MQRPRTFPLDPRLFSALRMTLRQAPARGPYGYVGAGGGGRSSYESLRTSGGGQAG